MVPKSKGGQNTWTNLVAACKKCNQKKGDRTPDQAGMKLIKQPIKPRTSVLRTIGKKEISTLWENYLWDYN